MTQAVSSPTSDKPIAFIDLGAQRRRLGDRIETAIKRVVEHGRYILGPEVAELEKQLTTFSGAAHTVTCANGTDALELGLAVLGLEPGDAVIVPSFTFCATGEAVARLGGIPVFVEVEPETFNLDPASVQQAIDDCAAAELPVVGIIPVDLFGLPADYGRIGALADEHGVWVIADAAQSFGASAHSRRVGTHAPVTTTSFFPAKPLGCYGDGGALFVDSAELADKLRSLRVHGKGTDKYDNVRIGQNSRLDTIQAAILLEKLAIFEQELPLRQQVADRYAEGLGDLVSVPSLPSGHTSAWAQYTIRVDRPDFDRSAVQAALREQGIPTAVYYPKPLHEQTAYKHYPVVSTGLAVSEQLAAQVLSLPMHPYLDEPTQARIIDALRCTLV